MLIPLLKWIAENVREDDPAFYEECVGIISKADGMVTKNEHD